MSKTKTRVKNLRSSGQKITIFDVKTSDGSENSKGYEGVIEAHAGQRLLKFFGVKATEVTVDIVQDNLRRFVSNVQQIIDTSSKEIGDYKIDTVEVNAEVSGNGEIGFMGTNVGMSGTAGIKLVFKKSKDEG